MHPIKQFYVNRNFCRRVSTSVAYHPSCVGIGVGLSHPSLFAVRHQHVEIRLHKLPVHWPTIAPLSCWKIHSRTFHTLHFCGHSHFLAGFETTQADRDIWCRYKTAIDGFLPSMKRDLVTIIAWVIKPPPLLPQIRKKIPAIPRSNILLFTSKQTFQRLAKGCSSFSRINVLVKVDGLVAGEINKRLVR